MARTSFASVDEYIAAHPEGTRAVLERVRGAIRAAVPRAEEGISYQIPVYKVRGRPVIYFAGWKAHYSVYPATGLVVSALKAELMPYEIGKGTIRFPLGQPVPVRLIARIAKLRAQEVAGGPRASGRSTNPS